MGNFVSDTIDDKCFRQKYELGDHIATGTFATVRYCKRRADEKEFAVKIVKKSFCTNNELHLLQDEIQIYSTIKHPNIINIYDVFQNDNNVKMVLELCNKQTLCDRMYYAPNFRLTEHECAYIAFVIGNTLKYLHSLQIVHRDIKPENILFTKSGVLKLTDFGSAFTKINRKVTLTDNKEENDENVNDESDDSDLLYMRTVIGTPNYAAPEILKQEKYCSQVDVWSLGVILFQCLSGYHPFLTRRTMKSIGTLYATIIAGKYKFECIWQDIDGEATDLVKKLIVVHPKQRLSTQQLLNHPFVHKYQSKKNPFAATSTDNNNNNNKNNNIFNKLRTVSLAPVFSPKPKPITLKSGILYKKSVKLNTYKQRLFELKMNGHLIYFELKANGDKIKKGEIILNPTIKIEKRSGGTRRNAKFIIHINENKKWYLWYNKCDKSITETQKTQINDNNNKQAQEWCDILTNAINQNLNYIHNKNDNINNKIRIRSKSVPLFNGCDADIVKENYLMLKNHGMYKQMYFVLNMNGKLDYFANDAKKEKKGCIDLRKQCQNVEKRRGSQKRDCKFIVYTQKNSFYFWCKDDKQLSFEWYFSIKAIIANKKR